MLFKHFIVASFFSLVSFIGLAQVQTPVKWECTYNPIDENNGELILKANVAIEWHIYSQTQSGDGPLPTVFKFERTPDFDLVGNVAEPTPEKAYSDVFPKRSKLSVNRMSCVICCRSVIAFAYWWLLSLKSCIKRFTFFCSELRITMQA